MDLVPFGNIVTADFARTLERDLATARERIETITNELVEVRYAANQRVAELEAERDRLREALEMALTEGVLISQPICDAIRAVLAEGTPTPGRTFDHSDRDE
jgi:predicted  nucleic acid-binding Zn-ribbon protein